MDNGEWQQEFARRSRVQRRISWATMSANACGIVLTLLYFAMASTSFSELNTKSSLSNAVNPATFLFTGTAGGILLIAGYIWGMHRGKIVSDWYLGKVSPGTPASERVRKLALSQPAESAMISMIMWMVAGLLSGAIVVIQTNQWRDVLSNFLSIGLFSGPIVGIIDYFLYERLWQPEVAVFFPEGHVSDVPALRLTVRRRVLVLFVMTSMPSLLLAFSAYMQATAISQAAQPADHLPQLLIIELFLVGVGILMAVVLGLTLGASLVRPIEGLRQQMDQVQRGNLDTQMPVLSNDELGELAEGFNAMIRGLQQEEVIRSLFSLYVTPEVAEHAIAYGAELGGQLAETTVLFSDIRGFTAMTEWMAPEALIALLNRYFEAMSDAVLVEGGLINKFGGDSLLAVFGTPLNATPDHALHAVRAAQGMLAALNTFNADQKARNEPTLRIGIGVATGDVVAGNVGSEERLEYTVIGDTVNLASRLQSLTKECNATVLVSSTTADTVSKEVILVPVGTVKVRGKQAPVPVFTFPEERESTKLPPNAT